MYEFWPVYFSDKIARELTIKHMLWIKKALWYVYIFFLFPDQQKTLSKNLKTLLLLFLQIYFLMKKSNIKHWRTHDFRKCLNIIFWYCEWLVLSRMNYCIFSNKLFGFFSLFFMVFKFGSYIGKKVMHEIIRIAGIIIELQVLFERESY